jgi:hypothetical protein
MGENMSDIKTLLEMLDMIWQLFEKIGMVALSVSGGCAWIASRWRKPDKPGFWQDFNQVVNVLGGNIGYATNASTDRRKVQIPVDELLVEERRKPAVINDVHD